MQLKTTVLQPEMLLSLLLGNVDDDDDGVVIDDNDDGVDIDDNDLVMIFLVMIAMLIMITML